MTNPAFPSSNLGYGSTIGGFGAPTGGANLGFGGGMPAMSPMSMDFGMPAIPQVSMPTVQPASRALPSAAAPAGAPAAPGADMGMWDRFKGSMLTENGLNFENIGSMAETLGSLGTLWSGIQSNRIARDSLNFQKGAYKTNLANQTQSYNTQVQDKGAARAAQFGDATYADSYYDKNKI